MKRFLDQRFKSEISKQGRERLKWLDWHMRHGQNVSLTARHFGLSRNTIYRAMNKFKPGCLSSLDNSSTKPKKFRSRTTRIEIYERTIQLRELYPRYGKAKIHYLLNQEGLNCSVSSVARILKEKGFPDARRRTMRKSSAYMKQTILRERRPKGLNISKPGEYVQMDSVIMQHDGRKIAIITILDLATRVAYAGIFKTSTSLNAWSVFERFQDLPGYSIKAVHTDNGSEFLGQFHENCLIYKIKHTFSQPRTPKQHAHIERFNRTLQDEGVFPIHLSLPMARIKEELSSFLMHYNFFRPHFSLKYLTPIRYYIRKAYPPNPTPQLFNMYWTNTWS
jgi:transposase InsO family protein